jgi:hypothetical protein
LEFIMSQRSLRILVLALVTTGLTPSVRAADPSVARVLKFTAADSQVSCAVILKATQLPKGNICHDHVILVDTSASQVGEHRQQSLDVLQSLLKSLPNTDRVRLFAADLQAEPLDDTFHTVRDPAIAEAVESLKLRVPLGATNLESVVRTAMKAAASDHPTDITYIGDGMSTADLIEIPELRALISELRQLRMPIHSFGVGARRNMQVLGTLGQQTGGFVAYDTVVIDASSENETVKASKTKSAKLAKDIARVRRGASERASEQGKILATAMTSPVYFPVKMQIAPEDVTLLPPDPLPIRIDRETIYLAKGNLPAAMKVTLVAADGEAMEWKMSAPLEQPGATFLPFMVSEVEVTRGLTNSLAGMPLFLLAQSDFSENLTLMAQRGAELLRADNVEQATKISDIVNTADPHNDAGRILRKSLESFKQRSAKPKGTEKPGLPTRQK